MTTATQTQIRRDTAPNLAGVTPALAELGMDTTNNRILIGDGTTPGGLPIPSYADNQKDTFSYAVAGGSANALTLALSPVTLTDADGQRLSFKATATNTASATMAIDGRSAITLKKIKSGALSNLEAGDIILGCSYDMRCIGGTSYLITSLGQTESKNGSELISVVSLNGSSGAIVFDTFNGYKNLKWVFDNVEPNSGNNNILLQVWRSGGSSWDTGTSDYLTVQSGITSFASDAILLMMQGTLYPRASGGFPFNGELDVTSLGDNEKIMFRGHFLWANGSTFYESSMAGFRNSTDPIIKVLFILSSGATFNSGNIYLYGERTTV